MPAEWWTDVFLAAGKLCSFGGDNQAKASGEIPQRTQHEKAWQRHIRLTSGQSLLDNLIATKRQAMAEGRLAVGCAAAAALAAMTLRAACILLVDSLCCYYP